MTPGSDQNYLQLKKENRKHFQSLNKSKDCFCITWEEFYWQLHRKKNNLSMFQSNMKQHPIPCSSSNVGLFVPASSPRSPCKESASSEEPRLLQVILPIRAFAQRLVQFRLWQLRSVSGQTACWSGQCFRSHYSFAQLRISHKLTCPHDRSLLSQRFSAAHTGGKIYGKRQEELNHRTRVRIVYFWMASIMSSCEKKKKKCQKQCHLGSRFLESMT